MSTEGEPEHRLMWFSSDALPPRDRFEIWRDTMTRKLLRVAIDPMSETPFRAKAVLRSLPQLRVGIGSIGPSIHHRTREIAANENDDVALLVNLRGQFVVRRGGSDWRLGPGDGFLLECHELGDFVAPETGTQLCVRLARPTLGAFARHVEGAFGRVIPAQNEALGLLITYARTLARGEIEYSPAAGKVAVDYVSDLTALLVGSTGEPAVLAGRRGLPAARLAAAKTYIRERLGQQGLTAERVASAIGITPRYLRQLFEAEARSFTAYVLEERLAQAFAMLNSRRLTTQPIAGVAFEVGFGDLSYFNRAFRRRFDCTPRDVRAEAMRASRMAAE
jgi:AraC-like DNA-binding protein